MKTIDLVVPCYNEEAGLADDGLASPSRTSASDTSHRRTNQPDMHRVSPNEAGDGVPRF